MAAAVGVAALAGWLARRPAGEVPGGMSQAVAVPRATARPDAARAAAGVRVAAGAPPRVAARPTAEPLVLVPPGQEEALRRFVVSLRDGALPTPPLLIAGTSVEGAVETPPLPDVPAVFVEPLSDAGVVSERSQR
jgi:hypothetical protein